MALNPLPKLTDEQRKTALARALAARTERADLKARMKAGMISVPDAMQESIAQKMRVETFLCSIPGIGKARAQKMMQELHIPSNRRVRGLGHKQRGSVLAMVEGHMKNFV